MLGEIGVCVSLFLRKLSYFEDCVWLMGKFDRTFACKIRFGNLLGNFDDNTWMRKFSGNFDGKFWLETWGWEFFKTWALLFCIFWSTKCGIVWLLCTFPCWKVDASLNEVCYFSLFCNVSWFALCTLIRVWEGNYICVSFNW